MSLIRIRIGESVAGAAGALLIASLLVTWYSLPRLSPLGDGATGYAFFRVTGVGTGWQAFAVADVVLTVLALSGPALLVAQATCRSPALPAALSAITVPAGAAATIVVVVHLLSRPDRSGLGAGAWLGLAGALGLLAGGWRSMAAERVRGMPAPHVEARPAPPAA